MKLQYILSGCTALLLMFGCNYNEDDDCYEPPLWCNGKEPETGTVEVRLSTYFIGDSAKITFYNDNVEGTVLATYYQSEEVESYSMHNGTIAASVNYSVMMGGNPSVITTVDGGELKYKEKAYCNDVICYTSGTLKLDLRLDATLLQ